MRIWKDFLWITEFAPDAVFPVFIDTRWHTKVNEFENLFFQDSAIYWRNSETLLLLSVLR